MTMYLWCYCSFPWNPAPWHPYGNGLCICCPNRTTKNTHTIYITLVLCSHSEALVSRKAVKEFPVEAHRSHGLVCVCVRFTLPPALTNVIYRSFHPGQTMRGVDADQTGQRNTSPLSIYTSPPSLPIVIHPWTKHFLFLFLPLWLSLSAIPVHVYIYIYL